MKKFLAILLAAALSVAAFAQADQRTVLAATTANGVTKTIYVGRIQADPAKDGSITITVFPDVVLTDSAGNLLAHGLSTSTSTPVPNSPGPFPLTLTPQQYAGLAALVQAAYLAAFPPSP